MRSSPSLDRGRFVLPRDLSAAAATGTMLVVAVLVVGWLVGGLIAGVWSPRDQAASAAGAAVTLAAPSDRDDAPRAAAARVSASGDQAPTAPRPAAARADAVRGKRGSRRAPRPRRRAAAAPSTPSPAPAVTPAATTTPVAAAAPVTADTDASPVERTQATSETKGSHVTTKAPAAPSRRPDGSDARGQARRGGMGGRPSPAPVPSPTPAGDPGGVDHGHGGAERSARRGK
jgi:hypothetical protein